MTAWRSKIPPAAAQRMRAAVREKYGDVAARATGRFPYPVGRKSALKLGYAPAWLAGIPSPIVARFVGVGNPFEVRAPRRGERVLDVGCGCGVDAYVASRLVGPEGCVEGIDLTPEMVEVARAGLGRWPIRNLCFRRGAVERLPFEDRTFDQVLTNGVLNLVPDKDAAFREIRRVLRPGGTLAAADLLVMATVPPEVLASLDAWSD